MIIGVGNGVVFPSVGPFQWGVDFTGAPLGKMTAAQLALIFPGLSFSRASAAAVQTSASTVDTSPLTDQPRIGSDGTRIGLLLEETRVNTVRNSRDLTGSNYNAGSTVVTTAANEVSPDGQTLATRSQVTSGGYSRYSSVGTATTGGRCWTCWFRRKTGVVDGLHQWTADIGAGSVSPDVFTATQAWQRRAIALTKASGTADDCVPGDARDQSGVGGHAAMALDIESDMLQFELGAFPTSHIVTTSASATRAGERLYYGGGAKLVDSAAFGLYTKLQPKGGATQYGANMRLWTIDANNYAEISATTQKISVVVGGGVAYTPATALAWNGAADTVEVQVAGVSATTNTVCKYRVNGGATVTLGTSGAPQGAYAPAGAIDLLCNGTANQFTAWVQQIAALRAGRVVL